MSIDEIEFNVKENQKNLEQIALASKQSRDAIQELCNEVIKLVDIVAEIKEEVIRIRN
jgi:hypothetical protein